MIEQEFPKAGIRVAYTTDGESFLIDVFNHNEAYQVVWIGPVNGPNYGKVLRASVIYPQNSNLEPRLFIEDDFQKFGLAPLPKIILEVALKGTDILDKNGRARNMITPLPFHPLNNEALKAVRDCYSKQILNPPLKINPTPL